MPDSPAQSIFDQTVRHRIALERYSTDASKQTLSFLEDLKTDLITRIARATPGRKKQLEALLDDVRALHGAVYQKITRALNSQFRDFAGREADWQGEKYRAAGIEATFNRVGVDAAFAAASERPMEGVLLKDWMRDLEPRARSRLERQLRIAWTEGESLDSTLKRVRGVIDTNGRAAKALIRTSNAHISAAVQQASFEANADLIKEVEWRSVLDGRTTPVCMARDGQRYAIDDGPRPPAHIGCRSIVVEVLKGFAPPQRETYGEWIKRQPSDVQDDILGPARGNLLRQGKFNVKGFVDARGKPLTLDELNLKASLMPPGTGLRPAQDAVFLARQAAGDAAVLTRQAVSDAAALAGRSASDAASLAGRAASDAAQLATQAVRERVAVAVGDIRQKLSELNAMLGQASAEAAVDMRQAVDELQTLLANLLEDIKPR